MDRLTLRNVATSVTRCRRSKGGGLLKYAEAGAGRIRKDNERRVFRVLFRGSSSAESHELSFCLLEVVDVNLKVYLHLWSRPSGWSPAFELADRVSSPLTRRQSRTGTAASGSAAEGVPVEAHHRLWRRR